MPNRQKRFAHAVAAMLAATTFTAAAQAAPNCGLVGRWHYNAFLAFGAGQGVVDCSLTIRSTGAYTSTCTAWTTHQASNSGNSSGIIKANRKCQLSGLIRTPGRDDTIIKGGHVRGIVAVLVGVRGDPDDPNNVRLVTLIKE